MFSEAEIGKSIIDSLINAGTLYYLDYEAQRKFEDDTELRAKIGGKKYSREMTTSKGKKVMAYYEIPFAIFSKV